MDMVAMAEAAAAAALLGVVWIFLRNRKRMTAYEIDDLWYIETPHGKYAELRGKFYETRYGRRFEFYYDYVNVETGVSLGWHDRERAYGLLLHLKRLPKPPVLAPPTVVFFEPVVERRRSRAHVTDDSIDVEYTYSPHSSMKRSSHTNRLMP